MIEIFKTQNEYDIYTSYNSYLQSDRLYYIKENGKTHFFTNNIDGEAKIYNNGAMPQGTKSITANGTSDVTSYESVDVNVPIPPGYIIPSGNISITENGTVDVTSYASATVFLEDYQKLIDRTLEAAYIPEGTTTIGERAFSGCSYLTSITIPNSITEIGASSLYGCSNLTSIDIPNSVSYIRQNAFYNCSSLTSITIPEGVTYIGSFAFSGCSNIQEIIVPDSVTTFGGSSIFANCSKLKKLTIGSGLSMPSTFNNSILGSNNMDSNMTLYYNSPIIYYEMFNASKIKNVYLGPNVSEIRYAFGECIFTNVTCYATTPPTMNTQSGDIFNYNVTKIYVPADSVDDYKTANRWSNYASKIEAIPTT